jgi:outer membrane PBP1 activator LpoA protein
MDGIVFGDMPWTLARQSILTNSPLSGTIQQLSLDTRSGYTRLYAFAIDIYNIIPQLTRLSKYNYERFDGLTGSLRIDAQHLVRRDLSWARFSLGVPKIIDKVFYGPTQVFPARQDQVSNAVSP